MPGVSFAFTYEIDPFGQSVEVEATVRLPPPGHSHGNDPDNNSFEEIDSVTLNGCNVNPDFIKVACNKLMPHAYDISGNLVSDQHVPEWFLLTDLLREAARERAEMDAA